MRTILDDNVARLEALKEKEREMPAGDLAATYRKRISDISGLICKADVAMEKDKSPEKYFQTIDTIFNDLEYETA